MNKDQLLDEAKQTLLLAQRELHQLRHRNEILSAKMEMVDLFSLVLNTRPNYPTIGAGEDVAQRMLKLAGEISTLQVIERRKAEEVVSDAKA